MALLKKLALAAGSLLFFILLVEFSLFVAGVSVVDPKIFPPKNQDGLIKVAVFGGSSAVGCMAGRSFADILEHEVAKTRKIYVRNFARNGASFRRNQAEILQAVADYFDIFIVYEGHNEIWVALSDRRYVDVNNLKIDPIDFNYVNESIRRYQRQFAGNYSLRDYLEGKSRFFAVGKRVKAFFRGFRPFQGDALSITRPALTVDRKVVPDAEIEAIPVEFKTEVEGIRETLHKKGKHLVLCTVPSQLAWPPMFSKGIPGKSTDLHAGENYRKGIKFLSKKEFAKAWPYLIKAKDEDGFPVRCLSGINRASMAITGQGATGVDVERAFLARIEAGETFDDYFVDFQHPNLRGQALIAREILPQLLTGADLEAARGRIDAVLAEKDQGLERYRRELSVTPKVVRAELDQSLTWLLSLQRQAADTTYFFLYANRAWDRLYPEPQSGKLKARYLAGKAVFSSFLDDVPADQITGLLKEAEKIDPVETKKVLSEGFPHLPPEEIAAQLKRKKP